MTGEGTPSRAVLAGAPAASEGAAPDALGAPSAEALLQLLKTAAFGGGEEGVAVIYRYASDGMRRRVGSYEVFRRAFGNLLYAPLLTHEALSLEEPRFVDDSARVELVVTTPGEEVRYELGLVRSRAASRAGLWTVSGVVREGVDL